MPDDLIRETYVIAGCPMEVSAPAGEGIAAVRSMLEGFGPAVSDRSDPLIRHDLKPTAEGGWQLVVDGRTDRLLPRLDGALAALEWSLVTHAIERVPHLFHLHAAALAVPTGNAALAIVGRSGAGKSTLTLALMRHGFLPYADDVTLIAPETLEVQVFRRSFHVDQSTWRLLGNAQMGDAPAASLNHIFYCPMDWAGTPARIRWIVFLERTPEVSELVPMQPADAATILLKETLSLARTPQLALAVLGRLTQEARCVRLRSGDLATAVDIVREFVSRD